MTRRPTARLLMVMALPWLLATPAAAEPFDLIGVSYEVNTGVRLIFGSSDLRDGLPIAFPIREYLAVRPYTAQPVVPGSGDRNESYVAYAAGNPDSGFGSALADASTLEVGIDKNVGAPGGSVALARMSMTIKNSHDDRSLDLMQFSFGIPAGHIEITDFSETFDAVFGRVIASIDYVLKSPAGGFGGTWDETTGSLLDYYVRMDGDSGLPPPHQVQTTSSGHADLTTTLDGNTFRMDIGAYAATLALPSIPPYGELTVYYDMYAYVGAARAEVLAEAFLGDPMTLSSDGWFRLTSLDDAGSDDQTTVPEPGGLLLGACGMLGAALLRATGRPAGRSTGSRCSRQQTTCEQSATSLRG